MSKVKIGLLKGYSIKLNNSFLVEWDGETGYQQFGDKKSAIVFTDIREAVDALVGVVWGGSDSPPQIVDVVEEFA